MPTRYVCVINTRHTAVIRRAHYQRLGRVRQASAQRKRQRQLCDASHACAHAANLLVVITDRDHIASSASRLARSHSTSSPSLRAGASALAATGAATLAVVDAVRVRPLVVGAVVALVPASAASAHVLCHAHTTPPAIASALALLGPLLRLRRRACTSTSARSSAWRAARFASARCDRCRARDSHGECNHHLSAPVCVAVPCSCARHLNRRT
jgi:hypothetical protein